MKTQHPDIVIRYIKAKNKTRKIVSYSSNICNLRLYHQKIEAFLEQRFIPSIFAKGYIKKRSIYHNALSHMYNDYFIMLDIKNFFPSICHKQLSDKLFREINLINANQINKKECNKIVSACSINDRGIPLGFITSPILSNIYLKEFDNIFYGKLRSLQLSNIIYTRYADDITVSFKHNALEEIKYIKEQIICIASAILKRYGLRLNAQKTRCYSLNISNHVRVTGINITKDNFGHRKLTIGRSIKNKLFWDAIECLNSQDVNKVQQIKGMQSFILSVEKNGYETCYSPAMIKKINDLGYSTLKDLIDML